jgi:hypothetical protein
MNYELTIILRSNKLTKSGGYRNQKKWTCGYRIRKLPTTVVRGVLTLGLGIKGKQGAVNDSNAV